MGITKMIRLFEKASLNILRKGYLHLKICEIGDQSMIEIDSKGNPKTVSAKVIYSAMGARHTSIDITGNDGALVINLDNPVPDYLLNAFDLITNYGTIEHVNNQFQAFKNVHDMTHKNGLMIHAFPPVGQWPGHCRYYYSKEFVFQLAKLCKYKIINFKIAPIFIEKNYKGDNYAMIMVSLLKADNGFITKEQFDKIPFLDTGDTSNTSGNYERSHKLGSTITVATASLLRFRLLQLTAAPFMSNLWFRHFFVKFWCRLLIG